MTVANSFNNWLVMNDKPYLLEKAVNRQKTHTTPLKKTLSALSLVTAVVGISDVAQATSTIKTKNGAPSCSSCHAQGYSIDVSRTGLQAFCLSKYPSGSGLYNASTFICTAPKPTATPTAVPTAVPTAIPTKVPTTTPTPVVTTTPKPTTTPTITPKPTTPPFSSGKSISGSVGSEDSNDAATDVYTVTCGRGTLGLNIGIEDDTSPTPNAPLTIQATKGFAATIVTAGVAPKTQNDDLSHDSDDDDDDDHDDYDDYDDYLPPSLLDKGPGQYSVLITKHWSETVGAALYTAHLDCVGKYGKKPAINHLLKQDD